MAIWQAQVAGGGGGEVVAVEWDEGFEDDIHNADLLMLPVRSEEIHLLCRDSDVIKESSALECTEDML